MTTRKIRLRMISKLRRRKGIVNRFGKNALEVVSAVAIVVIGGTGGDAGAPAVQQVQQEKRAEAIREKEHAMDRKKQQVSDLEEEKKARMNGKRKE